MSEDFLQLLSSLEAARKAASDLRVSAKSTDGLIIATVNSRGELVALEIDSRIYYQTDSAALSAKILSTTKAASVEAKQTIFAKFRHLLPSKATIESTDLDFDPVLHTARRAPRG